jgi:hypothetical protein
MADRFVGECICDHDQHDHDYGSCKEELTPEEVEAWEAKGVHIPASREPMPGVVFKGRLCPCPAGWYE